MATEQATEQAIEQAIDQGISMEQEITDLILQTEERIKADKNTITKLKALRKVAAKLEKKKGRRTRTPKEGKENGFGLPVGISPELAEFLGVPKDTQMSRSAVRNSIHEYAKTHNLRHPQDKRNFNLELEEAKPLAKLLGVPTTEKVTYFNLQRYLKPHFIKSDAPAKPAESPKDVKTKTQEALREATPEAPVATETKKKTIIRKKVAPVAQEV
jgi:upstream activation factor subunit UAF30